MFIYHKNKIINDKDVAINIMSFGFQFGIGFFTTLKYQNGTFQYLNLHLKRLHKSMSDFRIKIEKIDIEKILQSLIKINQLHNGRIKIIIYEDSDNIGKYMIIPQVLEVNQQSKKLASKLSIRGSNLLYKYKSLNYFENIYQKRLLINEIVDDFVFFDNRHNILETISSNIFFMSNNIIITPEKKLPILNGIIRQIICKTKSINVEEKKIKINELDSYNSCFITNSIHGIVPVESIIHKSIMKKFDNLEIQNLPNIIRNI